MSRLKRLLRSKVLWSALVGLFVLYLVVGFLVVPWVISGMVPKKISETAINGELTIGKARTNPFSFRLQLQDIRVVDAAGTDVAGLKEVRINFQPWESLFKRRYIFEEMALQAPFLGLEMDEKGTLNLANLAKPRPEPAADEPKEDGDEAVELPPLDIRSIAVTGGRITFHDRSLTEAFSRDIEDLNFTVTDFSTHPQADNPLVFKCVTDEGTSITWTGNLLFNPLSSDGTLTVEGFQPGAYSPYYQSLFGAQLEACTVGIRIPYRFDPAAEQPVILIDDASVALDDVQVKAPAIDAPLLVVPKVELNGLQIDLMNGDASLRELIIKGDVLRVAREKDNSINLITYLLPKAVAEAAGGEQVPGDDTAAATAELPDRPRDILYAIEAAVRQLNELVDLAWKIKLNRFSLSGQRIEWRDAATASPATLDVASIALDLTNLSNASGEAADLKLKVEIEQGGTIEVDGRITPLPSQLDLHYTVDSLNLAAASPYVQELSALTVDSAGIWARGTLSAALRDDAEPAIMLKGDAGVQNLQLSHSLSGQQETFLRWKALTVNSYSASTESGRQLSVDSITLTEPYFSAELEPDGKVNLQRLLPTSADTATPADAAQTKPADSKPANAKPAAAPEAITLPFSGWVKNIAVTQGTVVFRDQKIGPGYETTWRDIDVSIDGVSTAADSTIKAKIKAKEADGSTVYALATIDRPLSAARDIQSSLNLQMLMPPFSPYTGRFIGYSLSDGQLNIDQTMNLNGPKVDGQIKILVDQMTLGDKVESKDAVKLPIKLGLALLKDRKGQIRVPPIEVKGSLDDPAFSVRGIVWYAITNLLTKAATAPFSFLANAFGGENEEDLKQATFLPGTADMNPGEFRKLDTLAKALLERPGLALTIRGGVDREQETPVIKASMLAEKLQTFASEPVTFTIPVPEPPIVGLWVSTFPGKVQALTSAAEVQKAARIADLQDAILKLEQSGPEPAATKPAEPEPEKAGIITRLFRKITGSDKAEEEKEPEAIQQTPTDSHQLQLQQLRTTLANAQAEPLRIPWPTEDEIKDDLLQAIIIPEEWWLDLQTSRAKETRILLQSRQDLNNSILLERAEEALTGVQFEIKAD